MNRRASAPRTFWVAIVLVLTSCADLPDVPTHPPPDDGLVELTGLWSVAPVDGPEPPVDSAAWRSMRVPGSFDLLDPDLSPESWWRREVAVPPAWADLVADGTGVGVTLGKVSSAYELWVGDGPRRTRLGRVGSLPPDAHVDYDRHRTWPIPQGAIEGGRLVLLLRVWQPAWAGTGGGPTEGPFVAGPLPELVRREATSELPHLFLSIFFVVLGLFYLELFHRRRQERGYLWFATVSILFGVYSFLRTQWKYQLGVSFVVLKEVEYVAAYVLLAAFVQLIWHLLGLRISLLMRIGQAITLTFALLAAAVPGLWLNLLLLDWWQFLMLLIVARGTWLVVRGVWQQSAEARLIAWGALLGTATFVHDLLVDRDLLDGPRLTTYGFAVYVLFLAATLGEQFARRLREIEDLRRSEEAAERANRAKSEFLANVSHEIRTPMTAILGGSELLLRRNLDADVRSRLKIIQRAAAELLNIIDDILDFSKIEAGRLEPRPVDFDPRKVLRGVVELFAPQAKSKGVELTLEIPDRLPPGLRADATRLRQIVLNLVSNAVKFTDEGRVEVRAAWRPADGGSEGHAGEHLRVVVRDTGLGIARDDLPSLFQPFTQTSTNASRSGGTGLGLAICQRLAEVMEGSIEVESEPGVGSEFTLTIPAAIATTSGPDSQQNLDIKVAADLGARPRVLLADDNEVNRLIVGEQLASLGLEVMEADDGRTTLDLLAEEHVDLVLMDCQMPVLDGYETTRRIRAGESGDHHLPIIALTAHAFEGERERCLAAGMDDYLSKPFKLDDLRTILEHWLPLR